MFMYWWTATFVVALIAYYLGERAAERRVTRKSESFHFMVLCPAPHPALAVSNLRSDLVTPVECPLCGEVDDVGMVGRKVRDAYYLGARRG